MTDHPYADLWAALNSDGITTSAFIDPARLRALLADYDEASARALYEDSVAEAAIEQVKKLEAERDRLREALTAFVDYAENHGEITFAGGGMKAVDALNEATRKAQAALAQEHGESDA